MQGCRDCAQFLQSASEGGPEIFDVNENALRSLSPSELSLDLSYANQ